MKVGAANVELAAATPLTFRLSVSYDGKARPLITSFLDPQQRRPKWEVAVVGDEIGVKTAAGELLIDPGSGEWTLVDAKGVTLIPASSLGALSSSSTLTMPIKGTGTVKFYGSGNGVPSLQQVAIRSRVGNGVAVIPYYWSASGYSVLAVGEDENTPAAAVAAKGGVVWSFIGEKADLYLAPAGTSYAASRAYGELTGKPPVPPQQGFR